MLRKLLVLCLVTLVGITVAYAANTTSIQGKVTDSSGAAISNATVSLNRLDNHQCDSRNDGRRWPVYFQDVPSDPQIVTIEKSGFETFSQRLASGIRTVNHRRCYY